MNPVIPSGILNIDKPSGITSHDVVDVLRKVLKGTKIGHTGTLDPMATGLLVICIGDATKLSEHITSQDKKYSVKMLLGVETDTYDVTGRIIFASVMNKDEIYIKERIKRFIGKQMQTPPIYSAIRVDGKRAYEYAREGNEVKLKEREIEIYDISNIVVDIPNKEVSFDVHCSKGTYIRSLVNDIGKKIGSGATMSELRRIASGKNTVSDSIKLYDFLTLNYEDMIKRIISIEKYYKDAKAIYLNEIEYNKFLNGVKLECEYHDRLVRVYCEKKYKGIGIVEDNFLKRYIIE
ncbi:MAG: truB [Clostridia bacterium]|jgi:tRNA pseudouridine55 synthase|nr:truB [Clostridia bacterium]